MKTRGPAESAILMLDIIKILGRLKIPYAIIGAFAASFYGVVRASLDVDAVISVAEDPQKLEKLFAALLKRNLKFEYRQGDASDPIGGVINIEDRYNNRVDLLTGIRGMPAGIFKGSVTTTFQKQKIKIIGIEDFIAMKIYAGSAKDIQDVVGVLQVSAKQVDIAALKKLTLQYGKKEAAQLDRLLSEYLPR